MCKLYFSLPTHLARGCVQSKAPNIYLIYLSPHASPPCACALRPIPGHCGAGLGGQRRERRVRPHGLQFGQGLLLGRCTGQSRCCDRRQWLKPFSPSRVVCLGGSCVAWPATARVGGMGVCGPTAAAHGGCPTPTPLPTALSALLAGWVFYNYSCANEPPSRSLAQLINLVAGPCVSGVYGIREGPCVHVLRPGRGLLDRQRSG